MSTAPSSQPATSLKPDGYGALVGLVATVLGSVGIASKLGLSTNAVAVILGSLLIAVGAVRAWWEGTQYVQGGSAVDPIGVVSAMVLVVLGAFGVPAEFLTPDAMMQLVTLGFTLAAAARAAYRKRQATVIDTTAK